MSLLPDKGRSRTKRPLVCGETSETTALIEYTFGRRRKSTCARLASRFWDVDSGSVTLGGINLNEIDPETLLQYYAIVFTGCCTLRCLGDG